MSEKPKRGKRVLAPLVCFGMTSLIAIALFLFAFVMWLAMLVNSIAVAALITGGFFAILALVIYLLAVHAALADIRERMDTVYEVAARARDFYDWFAGKFSFLSIFRRHR